MFDAQRLFVTRASLTDCLTNHPGWCCREYHVWMISSDSGLLHKFSESALMCEKRRVPVVDLPVLVICGTESQSSCTKIICELQLKDIRFSCHPHREQLEVILWGSCFFLLLLVQRSRNCSWNWLDSLSSSPPPPCLPARQGDSNTLSAFYSGGVRSILNSLE